MFNIFVHYLIVSFYNFHNLSMRCTIGISPLRATPISHRSGFEASKGVILYPVLKKIYYQITKDLKILSL